MRVPIAVLEMVRKKFGKDFMHKSSFVWINAATNTIHW